MTSRDFCYWLMGHLELTDSASLSSEQLKIIKQHLQMVFVHEIDPSFPDNQQDELNTIHGEAIMRC